MSTFSNRIVAKHKKIYAALVQESAVVYDIVRVPGPAASETNLAGTTIKNSHDAYLIAKTFFAHSVGSYEQFQIFAFNQANRFIGSLVVGSGGLNATHADIKKAAIFSLLSGAQGVILAHNHPSGQLIPSETDKQLTRNFVAAFKILQISVLDHLILTEQSYFSFQDAGIL